jgi:predicted Zn-ribbon and HTH transcriptional regulator
VTAVESLALVIATAIEVQASDSVIPAVVTPFDRHIADAVIAAGYVLPTPPRFKCEDCGFPTEDAAEKFWCCGLCGSLDYEPNTPEPAS